MIKTKKNFDKNWIILQELSVIVYKNRLNSKCGECNE